ncbi:uracil-DNA glycosylase family protein [Puniceicoccus vermicola]|uniref:Single-stranded DNA-binding protein n=1 Tax=Puniceicoccus vermicola TaxID=388746 RepID=A0A7X1AZB9_9BACT|nr:uracil-DNA glycosylase family protein [Puniceicoccus vermicola]MBC2601723.1 single-stranded DNA-binding protein [Puniceicoccus vermicola]
MSEGLIEATLELSREVDALSFAEPTAYVYNPLSYAWQAHETYLKKWGQGRKRAIFLGMNPGPWGMAQIGVPFGEIELARDWVGIDCPVGKPDPEHPKRPIEGFACKRSEVSGRRLWGMFKEKFGTPEKFFADNFVLNYCPLVFMEESGRNRTPDKLPAEERQPLDEACDRFLQRALQELDPEFLVGVGAYAEKCLLRNADKGKVMRILHPSPASPIANRDWPEAAVKVLDEAGVW